MKVVIIGAGQTGRGFVAPFFQNHHAKLVFVDKEEELINRLQTNKTYEVAYFGDVKPTLTVADYHAYHCESEQAINAIANADVVTTSVFANQIESLISLFQEAINRRTKKDTLIILCIENGVGVKQPLIDANIDAIISEGVIFCTSIGDGNRLKITSEAYPELPIDGSVEGLQLEVAGLPLEMDFKTLIQRKIYTYNFFSAVVCYLGSYASYDSYAKAANDPLISDVLNQVGVILNQIIAKKYQVDITKQIVFGEMAIQKFQNRYIDDSIVRNAQQAARKLGANERLLTPLRFALQQGQPTAYFNLIIAAALYYGETHETMSVQNQLQTIGEAIQSTRDMKMITTLLLAFQKNIPLVDIVAMVNHV